MKESCLTWPDLGYKLCSTTCEMILDKNINLKIIIVDDSVDDHFFIKESLCEFKNITFLSFYSGPKFLDYIVAKSKEAHAGDQMPDVVILDINMPGLTGFEVFAKILEYKIEERVKFFILTTNLTDRDIENCRKLNLECNIKPFSIEKFSVLLQRLIKGAGLE
jgi:CheY-like chemotaxis protein